MKTVTFDESVKEVTARLKTRGVIIKESTVRMILETFLNHKKEVLSRADSFEEPSICTTGSKVRWSNTFAETVVPTVKLTCTFNGTLKTDIIRSICTDDELRHEVAPDMTLHDMEYLRRRYGINDEQI